MTRPEPIRFAPPTAVTRVADLFSTSIRDGGRVGVLGRLSEGDGGGDEVYYDRTSSETIDGGHVLPGYGGTLVFDGVTFDGNPGIGRHITTNRAIANMRKFGCVGDGSADDTLPAQRALNAVTGSASTSTLLIPPGTFRVNLVQSIDFNENNNTGARYRIQGEGAASVLRSAVTNDFAIRITGGFPPILDIESLFIEGDTDGSKQRHGVYINTGRGGLIRNCRITGCGLGAVYNATFGSIHDTRIDRCYCGVYYTTRVANTSVTQVNGQTVSLDAATFAQHSGFQLLDNVMLDINTIAMIQDQPDNVLGDQSNIKIKGGVLENNNVGVWSIHGGISGDYPIQLDHTWLENYYSTVVTVSFNGSSTREGDIICDRGRVVGDYIRPIKVRTKGAAIVELNNPIFWVDPTLEQLDNSSIVVRNPTIDNAYVNKEVEEWGMYTEGVNRVAMVPIPDRTVRIRNGPERRRRYENLTGTGAITVNFATGDWERKVVTLTGNVTVTLSAATPGEYWVGWLQDATGGRTVTYTTTVNDSGNLDAVATDANAYTPQKLYYDGTDWYGLEFGEFTILESEDCRNANPFHNWTQQSMSLVATDGPVGLNGCMEVQAAAGSSYTGARLLTLLGKPSTYLLHTFWLRAVSPLSQSVRVRQGDLKPPVTFDIDRHWRCFGMLARNRDPVLHRMWSYFLGQNGNTFRVAGIQVVESDSMERMREFMRSRILYYNEDAA